MKSFTGPGSTPSRRRFWDQVTEAVNASRKIAGRHVTVSEHEGKGTLINVDDTSARRGGGGGIILGACCYNDGTCDDLTESDCTDAGGNWQGPDTTCDDDPNPCVGACCEGEEGTTCVNDSTPDSCAADGGTFQDFGTTCADPDIDCPPGVCDCAFPAFDGSGRCFNNKSRITDWSLTSEGCTPEISAFVQTASGEVDLEWASCDFTSVENVNDCINCVGDDCSGTPIGYQCFPDTWIVDSATMRHQTCTLTFTSGGFTQTVVISSEIETLSGECIGTC